MARLPKEPKAGEVTPEHLWLRRRDLIKSAAAFAGTAVAVGGALTLLTKDAGSGDRDVEFEGLAPRADAGPALTEARTPYEDVTGYNNYYELGTDKADPAENAHFLKPRPWTVDIAGEVARPGSVDLDRLLGWFHPEERVYRMRCVEAWSMVIPWLGFPLADLVKRLEPTSKARYVEFTTLMDPAQLPGQRRPVLDWPYVEGLRLDEALHPLALLATGLYGKPLLGQNGAPLRLVVPWKYGFKGAKSIVRIRFTAEQPKTAWNQAAPSEYGFFANVNPEVDHPRWSQATERRLGEFRRRKTLPFNGYAESVASMYAGMDLRKLF